MYYTKKSKGKRVLELCSIVCITVLSLIMISSCTNYPTEDAGGELYRVGSRGVNIEFLDAKQMYVDGEFMTTQLLVHNKGAFDFPEGKISLSGFDKSIIHIGQQPMLLPRLRGKDVFSPDGQYDYIEVDESSPVTLTIGESYATTIQANICYNYRTIASPTVCMVYNPEDMNICKPQSISLGTQGAPIAIKKVDTEMLRDQVRFVAVIENVGSGTVVNPNDAASYLYCPYQLKREDVDTVQFSMKINGLDDPECTPGSNIVKLNKGIGILSCTFTLRGQKTYTTPLKITLDYEYMDAFSIETNVRAQYGPGKTTQTQTTGQTGPSTNNPTGDPSDPTSNTEDCPSCSSGNGNPTNDCYCSQANMKKWGGCVCLHIDGRNAMCDEGETEIAVNKNAGETLQYEIVGNNVVKCGNSANPQADCPFKGETVVPKKLSIYGKTSDGRTVSERCDLKVR